MATKRKTIKRDEDTKLLKNYIKKESRYEKTKITLKEFY